MASRAEDSDDVDTEFTHPPTDIFHPFLSDTPLGWVVGLKTVTQENEMSQITLRAYTDIPSVINICV